MMSRNRKFCNNFFVRFWGKISVEPTMWLYMMAYMITSVVEQAFFLRKSCLVNHRYPEDVCLNLSHHMDIKQKVQMTVSEFHQWNNIASHVVPIFLAMFIGNWSDRYGRKIPLIVGLIGKFIYSFMIVINSLMTNWNLNMIIYTASFPMGLLGGDISIFASCFAYISDITSSKERTLRVTILDVIYLSAMPSGIAVGSYLFYNVANTSFTIMFTINTVMIALAIIYSLYSLKCQTTSYQISVQWSSIFSDFFDKDHIFTTVKTILKKRSFHGRSCLCTVLVCMMLYAFQRDEKPLTYLYTQLKFDWGITQFSNFRTYHSALFVIAMLITVPIMNKCLLLEDTSMVLIGSLSHAIGRILFAIGNAWQILYLGAILAALGPIAAPALRSIASKIVPCNERGKVFAILSVCDNAVPLFSGVLYSQLYNATIKTTPSSIFWLTFATQIAVFLLMINVQCSTSYKKLLNVQYENKS